MRILNIFVLLSFVSAARYDFDFTDSKAISNLADKQSRTEFTTVFCYDGRVYFDNCKVKFGVTEQLPIEISNEGSGKGVEESGIFFSIEEFDVFFENVETTATMTTMSTQALKIIGSFESPKR